jgi:hypothetical protein
MEDDNDSECSINSDTPVYGIHCSFFDTKNEIDEVAFEGRCFVYEKDDEFFKVRGYMSEILINPTWRDLVRIADEIIETTEDYHHTCFEGYTVIKEISPNLFALYAIQYITSALSLF